MAPPEARGPRGLEARLPPEIADFFATGPAIVFRFGAGLAQDFTYTVAWLLFGLGMLAVGIAWRSGAARSAEGARTVTARWGEARALPVTAEAPAAPLPIAAGPEVPLERFRYRRAIAPGPAQLVAVPLDAAVLAHSSYSLAGYGLSGESADLRVLDDRNRQVPYLVERLSEPSSVPLTLAPASGVALLK